MTTKIFFVRHGDVDNPNLIFYERLPGFPLSEKGKIQASNTAKLLSSQKINYIYSSPLLRTKETAEIISNFLRLPLNFSDELLEVKSSLRGNTFSYVSSHYAKIDVFASEKSEIVGETIVEVADRMQKFIKEMLNIHKGKNVVAVTHGDPIMIVKAHIEKLPMTIDSIRPGNNKYIQKGEIYLAEFNS